MTDIEILLSWLKTYPGWTDEVLHTDYSEGTPGCMALYPKGVEELSRREDLLGNAQVQYRSRFTLRRQVAGQGDQEKHAQWMLDFQQWVQRQDAAGLAPRFGDVSFTESLRAENGALKEISKNGLAAYELTITAEYVKCYASATV